MKAEAEESGGRERGLGSRRGRWAGREEKKRRKTGGQGEEIRPERRD